MPLEGHRMARKSFFPLISQYSRNLMTDHLPLLLPSTAEHRIRIATHGSQTMLKIADKMGVWHDLEMERQDGNADGKGCFSIG